jgi:flavin-dependent dehydrogenase
VDHYDVVIVGARVGGAATAMLLARHGMRVLVVDRGRYGADTLSTHALMRGGVFLLSRWGLLDRIADAGTPPIRETRFDYGDESVSVPIKPTPGVTALYAPRRTLLDAVVVDAAIEAGAEVRYGITVTDLLRDGTGRIAGIRGRDRSGVAFTTRAGLTIGADGIRSTVARLAGSRVSRVGRGQGAVVYGYWSDLDACGYEWFYRNGCSAGIIPTNSGETCVFAGLPAARLTAGLRADLPATYHRLLAAATDGRLAGAVPPRRLHTWVGQPGFLRDATGPGWALVGDAGGFLDPLSTHGITDALRDAHILASCGLHDEGLEHFARTRDHAVGPIFDAVDEIASYQWTVAQVRDHLRTLNAAMNAELKLIAGDG